MPGTALRAIAALAILLALNACTSPAPSKVALPPPAAREEDPRALWERHLAAIAAVREWQVRGKVAYRLPEDAGSASLAWDEGDSGSELRLSGPLGAGSTRITSEGALLRLRRDGIERLYPADAAPWLPGGELLPVPVESIRHWLRGVPDPAEPAQALDLEAGLARHITQLGWEIDYLEYAGERGLPLPRRLTLRAPAAGLALKVILRDWRLP